MTGVFPLLLVVLVTMMTLEGVKCNDVTFFNEENFSGPTFEPPNDWKMQLHGGCLTLPPNTCSQTSSLRMVTGCMIVFDGKDCMGGAGQFSTGEWANLDTVGWNNRIASYKAC